MSEKDAANLLRQSAPRETITKIAKQADQIVWDNDKNAACATEILRLCAELLSSSSASAPVEAAGMREPDEAMLVAAREWSRRKFGKPIGNDAARGCWQAMFDAAPTDAAATKLDLHPVARAVADADRYLNEECVSRWKKGGAFKATEELQRLAKDMFSHCPLLQADAVMRARKLREYANAVRRDHLISGSVFAEFLEETANIFDGGEQ